MPMKWTIYKKWTNSQKCTISLNQEDIQSMNRSVTSKYIKSVILKFPRNKSPGPDSFIGEFTIHLEKS